MGSPKVKYLNSFAAKRVLGLIPGVEIADVPFEYVLGMYNDELYNNSVLEEIIVPHAATLCDHLEEELNSMGNDEAHNFLYQVDDITAGGYYELASYEFLEKYSGSAWAVLVELRLKMKELSEIGIDIDQLNDVFLLHENALTYYGNGEDSYIYYELPPLKTTLSSVYQHRLWNSEKLIPDEVFTGQFINYCEHFMAVVYSSFHVEDKPTNMTGDAVFEWEDLWKAEELSGDDFPRFDVVWFAFMDILEWFIGAVDSVNVSQTAGGKTV